MASTILTIIQWQNCPDRPTWSLFCSVQLSECSARATSKLHDDGTWIVQKLYLSCGIEIWPLLSVYGSGCSLDDIVPIWWMWERNTKPSKHPEAIDISFATEKAPCPENRDSSCSTNRAHGRTLQKGRVSRLLWGNTALEVWHMTLTKVGHTHCEP